MLIQHLAQQVLIELRTHSATYICPDDATTAGSNVTLQLYVLAGPSAGMTANSAFVVVSPSEINYALDSNLRHDQYTASCGYKAKVYLLPKDVSFSACGFSEGGCSAFLTGWYASKYSSYPHASGSAVVISGGNISTGCTAGDDDEIWSADQNSPPTFAAGLFVWQIPQQICLGSGPWHVFMKSKQKFVIDATGSMTASKHDSGPYTKQFNDARSSY